MSDELIGELCARAGELDRQIQTYSRKIDLLQTDLATMRAMLVFQEKEVFADDFLPHMSVRRLFGRNEIRRYCLDALSASPDGLDTRELARHAMMRKGMDSEDVIVRKKIVFSVSQTMKTARRRKFVESAGKRKGVVLWRLVGGKAPDSKRLKW